MKKVLPVCVLLFSMITEFTTGQTTKNPLWSFKNGIGLVAPDSAFSINFRFRTQNRFGIGASDQNPFVINETDFRIRRMRLRFDGFMLNPRLTYYIQLSFTRADQDWDNGGIPSVLRDAMIQYELTPKLKIGIGQGKLPGNRQRLISSGELQFTDRSIVNGLYTLDRDAGIFATWQSPIGPQSLLILKGAISSGEGRGIANTKEFSNTNSPNGGLSYSGRVELLPFGAFTNMGDYFEGDLEHEPKPKLSIAGGFHFNDRAIRTQGQLGKALYAPRSFTGAHLDMMFKYRGWALSSEYISRKMAYNHSPFTKRSATDSIYVMAGSGINTELSYTFKNHWSVAGRYAFAAPDLSIRNTGKDGLHYKEYCFALVKYLKKHRVKVVNEFSYYQRNHPETGIKQPGQIGFKCQLELGI